MTAAGAVALALVLAREPDAAAPAAAPADPAPRAPSAGPARDPDAGGKHLRFVTPHGPVHVWRPAGYDRRSAGVVVYVHGFYLHVDRAWREHDLAGQFAASGRNALFIAPEAPASGEEMPFWTSLDALVTAALERSRQRRPRGPLVAVGHSGAYRTLVAWLGEPALKHLVLVDALYGSEDELRAWLDAEPSHQMTLVVKGTARWADPFVAARPYAVTVPAIPDDLATLTPRQRRAKLLCLRSQYGHFELITEKRALPVLLRRTGVPALPAAARPGSAGARVN
jgi:hypothetical protein